MYIAIQCHSCSCGSLSYDDGDDDDVGINNTINNINRLMVQAIK